VEEVGRWLGAGLGGLINVFNPQLVVLGGYLSTMWPLVEHIVQAELRVRVMAPALDTVEIRPAQLGAEATLQGAAELALTRVLDDPTLAPAVEGRSAYAYVRGPQEPKAQPTPQAASQTGPGPRVLTERRAG
jgi:hypothetical protein